MLIAIPAIALYSILKNRISRLVLEVGIVSEGLMDRFQNVGRPQEGIVVRFRRVSTESVEGDLTPMIDVTFQLIAFFMVLINFTEADQDERIKLPTSQLAKPADGPVEHPVTIQLTDDGKILFYARLMELNELKSYLIRERDLLRLNNKTAADASVIIRADAAAETGRVQELIQLCQQEQFERFILRAKEEIE